MNILLFLCIVLSFSYASATTNTTQCLIDLGELLQEKYVSPVVSMEMIFSTGLGPGNFGNYEQCQALGKQIAQYCVVQGAVQGNTVGMGVCVPGSCTESDLQTFASTLLSKMNITISMVYCNNQHKEPALSPGGIVCLVVLVCLLVFTLIGSALTYLQQREREIMSESINDETDRLLLQDAHGAQKIIIDYPPWMNFFTCFSIQTNLSLLLNDRSSSGPLGMLNGLRVLMMFWVILGHTLYFQLVTTGYDNVAQAVNLWNNNWPFQFIYSAEYAVDVFFFLSGFLVVYLTLKEMKTGKKFPWVYYYVHRYWRLTPVYIFIIFLYYKFLPALGRGPLWFLYKEFTEPACDKYWWTNLLYINNVYPWHYGAGCMGWSWYLANDMQFFCIVPIILVVHRYSKKLGYTLISALFVSCFVANAVVTDKNAAGGLDTITTAIYERPYTRSGPYLVGVLTAILVIENSAAIVKFVKKTPLRLSAKFISSAIVFVCTYATYQQYKWTKVDFIIFDMFSRTGYVLGIAVFVLMCIGGNGGIPQWLLSARFWSPFAKLTYCAYLVHPAIMLFVMFQQTTPEHYAWPDFTINFIGYLGLSYAVALVMHLLVEKPCSNLERLVLNKKSEKH